MVPVSRLRRPIRGSILLLLWLSMLALLPSRPVLAQNTIPQPIDNLQGDFADGVFQRTSIGPDNRNDITPATGELPDQAGIVQLAPAGVLNTWESIPGALPVALTGAGITSLGERLYVIGGLLQSGIYNGTAYWAAVEPTTGSLIDSGASPWVTSALPTSQALLDNDPTIAVNYPACRTQTAARTRAGVASLATGANTGYIYVVGGAVNLTGCQDFSTALVQRGTVAADGAITWANLTSAPVPSPTAPTDDGGTFSRLLGVDGAATVIAHTQVSGVDRYFLYVIGGRNRYINGNASFRPVETPIERVLKSVYYTEIDIASGNLKHPVTGATTGVWKRDADIDLVDAPAANEGLWDATATATSVVVGTQLKSSIFLAGGSLDPGLGTTKLSSYIYRADVGTNGALTWAAGTDTVGPDQVSLAARRGMASLSYNNKLYLIGGRTANTAGSGLDTIPTSFIDDDLNLIKIDGSDFLVGTTEKVLGTSVGDLGRYNLGAALVRAEPPAGAVVGTLNSAWAYAISGSNNSGAPTATLYRGKIGGDDADSVRRAPDGWYYSGVIKLSFELGNGASATNKLARVVAIHWAADISRAANTNADIKLEFRKTITADGECADESIFSTTAPSDAWRGPVDGFAGDPLFSKTAANGDMYNSVSMTDIFPSEKINASCIQYRAHLQQNSSGSGASDPSSSPKLLSVYVEKVIAGNADISIPDGGFDVVTTNDRISAFTMRIQNLSNEGLEQTLSVDEALDANGLPVDGSFFVNLCIARADLTGTTPSLTIPSPSPSFTSTGSNTTVCPYFAEVWSAEMQKGTVLDLTVATAPAAYGGGARWYSNATQQPVSNILSAFSQNGHYRIGLVIDSIAGIPEGAVGEANNRGETVSLPNGLTDTFTVRGDPVNVLLLPLVRR